MTAGQVFKWFCKEQKLMPLIREMYYVIRPYTTTYDNKKGIETTYISFDEYANNIFTKYGFISFFDIFSMAYLDKNRKILDYNKFVEISDKFRKKIKLIETKWIYFAKNNIFILNDEIKCGNKIQYKHFGRLSEFEIERFDIGNGTMGGIDKSNNGRTWIGFWQALDSNGKEIDFDFMIKRNRKVYYGKNRK